MTGFRNSTVASTRSWPLAADPHQSLRTSSFYARILCHGFGDSSAVFHSAGGLANLCHMSYDSCDEVPHAGIVTLVGNVGDPWQLLNCVTGEAWTLLAGRWVLATLENGDVEVKNLATGRSRLSRDIFQEVLLRSGSGKDVVNRSSGQRRTLCAFLREHVVKYDTVHIAANKALTVKFRILARPSRGASVWWELADIAQAIDCFDRKGQKGKRWLHNSWPAWIASLAATGVHASHLRKAVPLQVVGQEVYDERNPWESRVFDEACASSLGLLVVLMRYWSPRVSRATEATLAESLLCAIVEKYLPANCMIILLVDVEWSIPWSADAPPGWAPPSSCDDVIKLEVADRSVSLSLLGGGEFVIPGSARAGLHEAFQDAVSTSMPIVEFLKRVWNSRLLWVRRQVLWWLHLQLDRGVSSSQCIERPALSPRPAAPPGGRQDAVVLQSVVLRDKKELALGTSAGRQERLHPALALRRGDGTLRDAELLFVKRYLSCTKAVFADSRHLHLAADSSRIGGHDLELIALFSSDKGMGCWSPPQAPRLPSFGVYVFVYVCVCAAMLLNMPLTMSAFTAHVLRPLCDLLVNPSVEWHSSLGLASHGRGAE